MMAIKKAPRWRAEHGVSENDHYVPIVTHARRRRKRIRFRRTTANEIVASIVAGTLLAWLIQTTIAILVDFAIRMGTWM